MIENSTSTFYSKEMLIQHTTEVSPNKSELPSICLGAPNAVYNDTFMPTGYSFTAVVGLSVFVGLFCLYVLLGNVAVVLIILRDRVVGGQAQNQYLVSLAVADALLAVLVIPFSLVNELSGIWPFGRIYCQIYLAADVLFCTASIWNICAIGLDRYWSVKRPIANRRKRTKKVIRFIILMVWCLSFLISVPPFIFGFKLIPSSNEQSCFINDAQWYILFSSTLSFFLPVIIIAPVYTRIYLIGRKHSRPPMSRMKSDEERKDLEASEFLNPVSLPTQHQDCTKSKKNGTEIEPSCNKSKICYSSSLNSFKSIDPKNEDYSADNRADREYNGYTCIYTTKNGKLSLPTPKKTNPSEDLTSNGDLTSGKGIEDMANIMVRPIIRRCDSCPSGRRRMLSAASTHSVFSMTSLVVLFKRRNRPESNSISSKRSAYYHKRERRFTLIICLVTGGFLFCWYPFFQTYVAYALCGKTCCINKNLFKAIFWLGYLNSGINPAIYTIFNKEFRRAFRKLFLRSKPGEESWKNNFR
uniref:alpha-2Da adrenergic receptor-like n=1 Tax=Styela clava TaxID=7725 RepID=UPI00193959D5|nr:alpha-2Da adrenergic receptor-like [Styela clava]